MHIREAHEPGVFDLLVYRKEAARVRIDGEIVLQEDLQIIRAWVELKVDKPTKPAVIEVSQKEFGRIHWTIGHNALFCTFDVPNDKLVFQQGDLKGRSIILPGDPYAIDWPWVFEKFKSRSK